MEARAEASESNSLFLDCGWLCNPLLAAAAEAAALIPSPSHSIWCAAAKTNPYSQLIHVDRYGRMLLYRCSGCHYNWGFVDRYQKWQMNLFLSPSLKPRSCFWGILPIIDSTAERGRAWGDRGNDMQLKPPAGIELGTVQFVNNKTVQYW